MKITNFKPKSQFDYRRKYWLATVQVQTSFLFWKKSEEREVVTTVYQNLQEPFSLWRFADTGEYCPNSVRSLAELYLAKRELRGEESAQ